jgi:hypothetical protein
LLSLVTGGVTHFILMPLHYVMAPGSVHRFQSKQLILGRMQCNMSFVAHGCCRTSALKSHIIGSQCQPFGKPHDSKIYSI